MQTKNVIGLATSSEINMTHNVMSASLTAWINWLSLAHWLNICQSLQERTLLPLCLLSNAITSSRHDRLFKPLLLSEEYVVTD